jgi:hypothetical protein
MSVPLGDFIPKPLKPDCLPDSQALEERRKNRMGRHSGKKKIKPCLRCDKPTETTPEKRLCKICRIQISDQGLDSGYPSKAFGNKQIEPSKDHD